MSTECGFSTQKLPEIKEKGYYQSPENLTWFLEIVTWFRKSVTWLLKIVTKFPKNVTWFQKNYDKLYNKKVLEILIVDQVFQKCDLVF